MPRRALPDRTDQPAYSHSVLKDHPGPYRYRHLSDPGGPTRFYAFHEEQPPGCRSGHRHWPDAEDALLDSLNGGATLQIRDRHAMTFMLELYSHIFVNALRCVAVCGLTDRHWTVRTVPGVFFVWSDRHRSSKVSNDVLPTAILQTYLDDVADAVMNERFELYCARIQLPLNIVTSSANLRIDTIEDLQDGFDDFTEMLQGYGVTRMVRTVNVAKFEANDRIVGIYQTRLMDASRQVLPEFHSKMWLCRYDGIWKAIRIHNTTNEARWPLLLSRLAPEPWPTEEL